LRELSEISKNGDNFVHGLIEKLLKNGPVLIDKIFEDYKFSDFESLKRTAHYFKSSSGNLGAERIASLCSEIQNLSEHSVDFKDLLREMISKLRKEWLDFENVVRQENLSRFDE
jgi:HPt (histidine-containing phosphotransfer) domain-containing protein